MVPDPSLTIREGAVAAWPKAWQGVNLRDILTELGYDVDVPWHRLPKKQRNWILFTEEQPVVLVHPSRERNEIESKTTLFEHRRVLSLAMESGGRSFCSERRPEP